MRSILIIFTLLVTGFCAASNSRHKRQSPLCNFINCGPPACLRWCSIPAQTGCCPHSYRYPDRPRPGACPRTNSAPCAYPYPPYFTKYYECKEDFTCPEGFKCCHDSCFYHRICKPTRVVKPPTKSLGRPGRTTVLPATSSAPKTTPTPEVTTTRKPSTRNLQVLIEVVTKAAEKSFPGNDYEDDDDDEHYYYDSSYYQ